MNTNAANLGFETQLWAGGVDILHPVQSECVDVRWVKREYGKHMTLWGGYGTQGTMVFGTPDQIRQEVNELCDVLGSGGGFILTPGLAIQNEVPVENAAAFIEVALEREQGGLQQRPSYPQVVHEFSTHHRGGK